ncbi:MAG TPA: helix-turn-helix transcriptional regulator [Acidiferrobacterales bacterium]|nr:helix-turn-helix transcriptional regulator [Acidiferrobacterales bacterium]
MQRPSVYTYTVTDPPGVNVHRLRNALGLSQRALAEKCHPTIEHTTVRRLENNLGFTQDTLERVAKALGVQVYELFLPPELAAWPKLSQKVRKRLAESIQQV